MHYRAIRLVILTGISGLFCVGTAAAGMRDGLGFAILSWVAVVLLSALFITTDHVAHHRGLSQRAGFALLYGWLWAAWQHSRGFRKYGLHDANAGQECRLVMW